MVVRDLVSETLAHKCVEAVNGRIQETLRSYDVPFAGPQQLVTAMASLW